MVTKAELHEALASLSLDIKAQIDESVVYS